MYVPPHTDTPKLSPTVILSILAGSTRPERTIHKKPIIIGIVTGKQHSNIPNCGFPPRRFGILHVLTGKHHIVHPVMRETFCLVNQLLVISLRQSKAGIGKHVMFISKLLRELHIDVTAHPFLFPFIHLVTSFSEQIFSRITSELQMVRWIELICPHSFFRNSKTSRYFPSHHDHPLHAEIIRHVKILTC